MTRQRPAPGPPPLGPLHASVTLRAYGPLGDFLPVARRGTALVRRIDGSPAVKDVVEAAGIPHPEVALVVVDGTPVGFEHRLEPGDRVAVYPPFRSLDLGATIRAGPAPMQPDAVRFVLDGHLGRLAAYLRMCGFDTWYEPHAEDDTLARIAADEDRILLTRDLGLLKRSIVGRGAFVRSDRPAEQLAEILDRFDLPDAVEPFGRCLRCNALLESIDHGAAGPLVPPRVHREQSAFRACPVCGGVFWRGSHHRRMQQLLVWAIKQANGGSHVAAPRT